MGKVTELSNAGDRVDKQLLFNLKSTVIQACNKYGMELENAYNLMSQCILIKYLEDCSMLTQTAFTRWKVNSYTELLEQNNENYIYDFFCFLKNRFNGDLFSVEKDELPSNEQISIFYYFFRGYDYLQDGHSQLRLFPYDFSVIPISLISNIYETFFQWMTNVRQRKKQQELFIRHITWRNLWFNNVFQSVWIKRRYHVFLNLLAGLGPFL